MKDRGCAATEDARLSGLMAAAQAGDKAAYATLLRDCVPFIKGVARGMGGHPDRIDDVVQDVLLAVHRARRTYDPARPFLPWLRVIAQRRTTDSFRIHSRQHSREVHAPLSYEAHPDPVVSADHALGHAEQAVRLQAAIARLPSRQREAMEHLARQDLTLAQAAGRTGRTTGALKVSLHRALTSLRHSFAKEDDHP